MFLRTRTINGHEYEYEEYRYREGGKVRSRSIYLGRKKKALSYSDEQQEKERLEQERIDRIVAAAVKYGEREEERLKKAADKKDAAPNDESGNDDSKPDA